MCIRDRFYDRVSQAIHRSERRTETDVAVLLLDIDGYRAITENIGRPAAEEVLKAVAPRLETALRPEDTLARLGRDEFVVLLTETTPEDADSVAERLLARLSRDLHLAGRVHRLSASIGVSLHESGLSCDDLVRRADRAVARAKEQGRGRVEFLSLIHI